MSNVLLDMNVDEDLRLQLLAQEQKMRSRQPEAWTKTKFRKYANFGRNRKKTAEEILGIEPKVTKPTKLKKAKNPVRD
ncbi:MAG: hypothetical protein WCI04_05985 [archaeon]